MSHCSPKVGITMRMMVSSDTGEIRHCIADDWVRFIDKVLPNVSLIPIPNHLNIRSWVKQINLKGIILSGGEDWGEFPLRDSSELALCEIAESTKIPLLGICRGMQVLNYYWGGRLPTKRDESHIAQNHYIQKHHQKNKQELLLVNSYHRMVLHQADISEQLIVSATCFAGTVESIEHPDYQMKGIMWHPERLSTIQQHDQELFNNMFGNLI